MVALEVGVDEGSEVVVWVRGEVDLANVDQLRDALATAVEASPEGFVVDASATYYMDTAGIAAILWAYRNTQPGGRLALLFSNDMRPIIQAMGIARLPNVVIRASLEDARRFVSGAVEQ